MSPMKYAPTTYASATGPMAGLLDRANGPTLNHGQIQRVKAQAQARGRNAIVTRCDQAEAVGGDVGLLNKARTIVAQAFNQMDDDGDPVVR